MLLKSLLTLLLTNLLWFSFLFPSIASAVSEVVEVTVPDTTITIEGFAAPNAIVTISESGSPIGTSLAGPTGAYSVVISAQKVGILNIQAFYEDVTGLQSAISSKKISVSAQQNTTAEFALSPTITRRTPDSVVKSGVVQISGYTSSGATVTLSLSNGSTRTTKADTKGYYEFLIDTKNLNEGDYKATSRAVTSAGSVQTARSLEVLFRVVSKETPSVPDLVVAPDQLPPPIPQSPNDGDAIDGNSVVVSGESVPNAQIVIYENGEVIGSIFANENGEWSFEYTATSSPVTLSFEACINGRCSVLSQNVTLTFSLPTTATACELDFHLEQYRFWGVRVNEEISLTTRALERVGLFVISWGDGTNEEFNYDPDQPRSISQKYDKEGSYNGRITFYEGNNRSAESECFVTRYFSVRVDQSADQSAIWQIALLLAAVALGYGAHSYIGREKETTTKNT